ncbi:MAG: GTPase HflX [Spirochaetales bacterium]|uniref:GTPase HflX n=1 Tax=Candidatus Thalassospirochaeta sargassi TaxID=3119039 RepID=A0AAJ1MIR3_9SPIO|nr:GTPase HflX [Spirochaetales bacterium]
MDRAVLVTLKGSGKLADELITLCESVDIETIKIFTVPLNKPSAAWLLGSGKTREIIDYALDYEADMIVFNPALSPSQQRNWEKESGLCVIDRHEIILEIFSSRATTREASLQTGLARMEYSLPRLTRAWTHLSRQRGGTRGTRGEGETQLEIDRRIVLKKISRMKRELEEVKKQRAIQRAKRAGTVPSACIVGYTNAGKSSLLNLLCDAGIKAEDKLFATLDPTTRSLKLSGGGSLTLTDTVGFIRDLPHKLVQAFHSTLEEAVLADFLIHVIDSSDSDAEAHYRTTLATLKEIGAGEKRIMTVFNKIDCFTEDESNLINIKGIQLETEQSTFCSVKTGEGIDQLLAEMERFIRENRIESLFRFPADGRGYKLLSELHSKCEIISEDHEDSYIEVRAVCPDEIRNRYAGYILD